MPGAQAPLVSPIKHYFRKEIEARGAQKTVCGFSLLGAGHMVPVSRPSAVPCVPPRVSLSGRGGGGAGGGWGQKARYAWI